MSDKGFDLYRIDIPGKVIDMMPKSIAHEHSVIPVEFNELNRELVVAMAEWDTDTLEKLKFIFNCPVSVVFASPEAIRFALGKYFD